MRKIVIAAFVLAVLPLMAEAQVEKQVEVTKAYVPSLESASKLAVAPDMTDTVKLRPEIDYTITPLSIETSLQTRPIRPATVTYWEFNRPLPFYLKVGAGYPLNSVLDFYASTQNPGTGYVVGFLNHEGRYADIRNDFGLKHNSIRMTNRAGAAAGKYFGRRVLEGRVNYENRLYHRYGSFYEYETQAAEGVIPPLRQVDFGDAQAAVRFGDDFLDLRRFNFEVALRGGMFFDHSNAFGYVDKARQTTLAASAKIARGWNRHRFSLEAGYERLAGQKSISDYRQQIVRAAARYGIDGGVVRFEAGADYFHDKIDGTRAENYIVPFLRMAFDLGTRGLRPFVEADGGVYDNSYRSLTRRNPYVVNPEWLDKSSVDYNGRFGIGGNIWRDRFVYRVYAAFSVHDNHVYWYGETYGDKTSFYEFTGAFVPKMARQTVTSFNGEIEFRPISRLRIDLGVHGFIYNDDDLRIGGRNVSPGNGAPAFRGNAGLRYEDRKVAFGVKALFESVRRWTQLRVTPPFSMPVDIDSFEAPFAVDLSVDFAWKITGRLSLFAEGRNLLDRRLYRYPWYPEYGANFTLGVKANF